MNKKSIYIHYFKGYSARNMHISWFLLQFHLSNFDKEIRIRLCYHDLAGGKEKRKKPIIRFFRPASGQSTKQFHILKLPGERRTFLRHLSRSSQGRAPTALPKGERQRHFCTNGSLLQQAWFVLKDCFFMPFFNHSTIRTDEGGKNDGFMEQRGSSLRRNG